MSTLPAISEKVAKNLGGYFFDSPCIYTLPIDNTSHGASMQNVKKALEIMPAKIPVLALQTNNTELIYFVYSAVELTSSRAKPSGIRAYTGELQTQRR